MKNFDATRRWLKCVMGWTRRDRCWDGKGHEQWRVPDGHPGSQYSPYTYERAMRRALKDARAQGLSLPDFAVKATHDD